MLPRLLRRAAPSRAAVVGCAEPCWEGRGLSVALRGVPALLVHPPLAPAPTHPPTTPDESDAEYNEDAEAPYCAVPPEPKAPRQPRKKKARVVAAAEEEGGLEEGGAGGAAAAAPPAPALPDDFAAALMAATMVRAPSAPAAEDQQQQQQQEGGGEGAAPAPSQATAASGPAPSAGAGDLPAEQQQQQQQQAPQDVQQPAAAAAAAVAAAKPKLKIKLGGAPKAAAPPQPAREPSRALLLLVWGGWGLLRGFGRAGPAGHAVVVCTTWFAPPHLGARQLLLCAACSRPAPYTEPALSCAPHPAPLSRFCVRLCSGGRGGGGGGGAAARRRRRAPPRQGRRCVLRAAAGGPLRRALPGPALAAHLECACTPSRALPLPLCC